MEPTRRSARLPWGELSYLEWLPETPGNASVVVLLHGGGLDSATLSWGATGGELAAAGHRVIAPDAPGYGRSPSAPWPATHDRLVEHVDAFTRAIGLERYALAGLSMGGAMALGHTFAHPERVRGTILIGTFGIMDHQLQGLWSRPWHLLSWAMTHTGLMGLTMRAYAKPGPALRSSLRGLIRNEANITPALLTGIADEAERGTALAAFDQWQRDQLRFGRLRTNLMPRLGSFPRPALIIHGEHDTGVPVALARRAAERMPDARFVEVADAGHWTQRDVPEVVVPAMLAFLDELAAADEER